MLRDDGDFVIYVVQHQYRGEGPWAHSGDAGNFAANIPAALRYTEHPTKFLSPWRDFGACGECWQSTGVCGAFDPGIGMAYVGQLTQFNPQHRFRLLQVNTSQHSKPYTGGGVAK